MPLDLASLLGTLAAFASTISFAPQAWKVIRSRQTRDISAAMYAVTVTGFALWAAYGFVLGHWPIILSNLLCLGMAGFILFMKLAPQRVKEEVAEKLDPEAKP